MFLAQLQEADRIRPGHLATTYNLACGYALTGQTENAARALRKILDMKVAMSFENDPDLESLTASPFAGDLILKRKALQKPVNNSVRVFSLDEDALLAEGVAYDPVGQAFFVGSVHKRKIVKIDVDQKTTGFAAGEEIWSVFGLSADPDRRWLWACTAAIPQMLGYADSLDGRSAVLKFDLDSGKLLKKYLLPKDSAVHVLGDLAVMSNGDVYITDSRTDVLYRIRSDGGKLEAFLQSPLLKSAQGLSADNRGGVLYVADYSNGILRIDLPEKAVYPVFGPDTICLQGIDGLGFFEGSLIVIQNGITPHRVVRLVLDKSGQKITGSEILEMNHPDFDEPTLGIVQGRSFYYVANSQWGNFDVDGAAITGKPFSPSHIFRLPL